jgi:FkbM family methyltransferase
MKLKQTQCSKGAFIHLAEDLYIPESLVKYDGWENEVYDECKKYIKPNSNIIEVGAHIGTHCIPLSKLTEGYVIAFEMQRFIYQMLNTNIILNNRYNIITYKEAVSNQNDMIYVGEIDYSGKGMNSGNVKIQQLILEKGFPIPRVTLDQRLKDLMNIDLIKIDVECHELEVLQGAMEIIKKNKPVIVTEYHTIKTEHTNGNKKEIMELLPNYKWKNLIGRYELNNKEIYNFNMIGIPND